MQAPFGKLALREKGNWWVAYLAPIKGGNPDTFTEIGRIRMNLVTMDPMLKEQFIVMMKAAFDTACREALGTTPEWPYPVQPAKDD
jgi:hypothetical protein